MCYGAMVVVSLPALGKSLVVACEARAPPPARPPVASTAPVNLDENPPATFADLFSILQGEWLWLALTIAVTLLWTMAQIEIPGALQQVTEAWTNKESLFGLSSESEFFSAAINILKDFKVQAITESQVAERVVSLFRSISLVRPTRVAGYVWSPVLRQLGCDGPIVDFVLLQVSVMGLDSIRHFLLSTLGERVRQRLRVRLYTAMLQQEIGFFDANAKGQLMSMMGEDVARMQQAVTDNITSILQQFITICLCARQVLKISPKATLLVVASVPLLSAASIMAQKSSRARSRIAFESARENAATASEVLTNARTVQAFTAEEIEAVKYAERMARHTFSKVLSAVASIVNVIGH